MSAKHTPGPWHLLGLLRVAADNGNGPKLIANVYGTVGHEDKIAECEANAHLISAATELLAALQETLNLVELHAGAFEYVGTVGRARQAIAKASGEEVLL